MLEIQKNTLFKAIKLLNSIGVEYAILANEEKYGTLEILEKNPKPSKRSYSKKYGRGVILKHVRTHIDDLKVGDVVSIPAGDYELDAVANAAASYAHRIFGRDAHTGYSNKDTNTFELLRLEV